MSNKFTKMEIDDSISDKNVSELNSKPLESIFLKSLKKMKWYKSTLVRLFFIYIFPFNYKKRVNQQLEIFIRYFNRSYNSNYHIENLDITFYNLFLKYVNARAIRCAFYFYCFIFIILIIFLVIFTTIKLS